MVPGFETVSCSDASGKEAVAVSEAVSFCHDSDLFTGISTLPAFLPSLSVRVAVMIPSHPGFLIHSDKA